MNRITTAVCPRCGAELQPVPGHSQATCAYCGTTFFVEQPRAPVSAPRVPSKLSAPLIIGLLGVSALVLLGITVSVLMLTGSPEASAPAAIATSTLTAAAPTPAVAPDATDSPEAIVTAFTVTDGIRRWTVSLTDQSVSLSSLVTSATHVFLQAEKQLFILDAANGKAVAVIGTAR